MKIKLLLIGWLSLMNIYAQKITISLPKEAGKEYSFTLNQGLRTDTVQKGVINSVGTITINIPDNYNGYTGIADLNIADGKPLKLIIHGENFSADQLGNDELEFTNSRENNYLSDVVKGVNVEADTSLYASRFIDMMRYVQSLNAILYHNRGGLYERSNALIYGVDKLNMEDLYTSGLWYYGIDGILKLSGDQENFADNMVNILKRIKSEAVFEALSKDLVTITEQYGYDDAFDIIIPYILQSGRIKLPTGNLYTAFALAKIQKGSIIPEIVGLKKKMEKEKILLVFFQPDCPNCDAQMEKLMANYPEIEAKNIRIISISAGYDKTEYERDCKRFPWPDNICDFKGFAGANFINYGITSTPTFFLADKDHKLMKRFALVSDIFKYIN